MNFLSHFLLKIALILIPANYIAPLFSQVSVREEQWVLPTYPVDPGDKNPVFFRNESYQGASKYVYPLALNDVISEAKTDKAWKAVILENDYIKLCVTPEIGGKLYYATDKSNNYNFIYKNNVVRPSNIGMTGAWVSGGIEWCVFHHHRASTFLPIDYEITENDDGSKTIWVGETEPRHRMRWTVGITVFPDRSYFQAEIRMLNPTPFTNTFLYWANVAAHTNENYQVIFPPSVQFATYHAKNSFTRWPVSTEVYTGVDFTRGVDISWWKNVVTSNSFFAHDLKEDFMGGYDHGKQTGTVHIGDHNIVKGAKLWEWGSGPRGQATEGRLTENDGPYVEIMTGAFSDNQPDYSWIRPYEVKTARQYWYPVKDIRGFKNANLNGAVNLEAGEKNTVFLGYYSTRKVDNARVVLRNRDEVLLQKDIEISPMRSFTATVKIDGPFKMTDLSTEMINTNTGETLISYQPDEIKRIEELPETVKAPPSPKDITTVEEIFLTGSRIGQFHNPRYSAMDYYNEALSRDPGDIRTNIAVGNFHLTNGNYALARKYFATALKRLARDYTRPSDCEAFYLQGLTLAALRLTEEATDTLYRATWDYAWHSAAFLELARISSGKGDYARALDQIEESLSTNSRNNRAVAMKASYQRRLGDQKSALKTIGDLYLSDPLDFRIANEVYLINRESGNEAEASFLLKKLTEKMRDYDQNYLELAVAYLNDGLAGEAEEVLLRFKGNNPIMGYYLGYIEDMKGNNAMAGDYFKRASEQPVDYTFPFRFETLRVLEKALEYNSSDSRAYYYMGNILYDKQPARAIECWEAAVRNDSSLAIAYRNLGWGYHRHYNDLPKAISFYEKAFSLDRNEAIWYTELDALYEVTNTTLDRRLALFENSNDVVRNRDDAFVRQITVLTMAGRPDRAVEFLEGKSFSYREGNSRVREVIIDAQLMLGKKYFEEKNYRKALEHFLQARVPDEEAGSARSGNRDIQVNYYIGLAYEALRNNAKARTYFRMAADQNMRRSGYMTYYQGLSLLKLGNNEKAEEIFTTMVAEGESQINRTAGGSDFFAIFGEREAAGSRNSMAYTIRGLGYKGLGDNARAEEDLRKAVELSYSNLWANAELNTR